MNLHQYKYEHNFFGSFIRVSVFNLSFRWMTKRKQPTGEHTRVTMGRWRAQRQSELKPNSSGRGQLFSNEAKT